MKNIIYIGNFDFPDGNAAGKRVFGNVKILEELGFVITLFGISSKNNEIKSLRQSKEIIGKHITYRFSKKQNLLNYLMDKNINCFFDILEKEIKPVNIEAIIYYGTVTTSLFLRRLFKFARKNSILIIGDTADILSYSTKNIIFNCIKRIDSSIIRHYHKNTDGLIVISKYLQQKYSSKRTILIPPLSEKYESGINHILSKNIKFIYSGMPFRKNHVTKYEDLKDRIDIVFDALAISKRNGVKFHFDFFGFDKLEILTSLPKLRNSIEYLNDFVSFHGFVDNEKVLEFVHKADFMVLIRNSTLQSNAGFPTKVSESINCGTPVITTMTSDIALYLTEGKHVLYVEDSVDSLVNTIDKISIDYKNIVKNMKQECSQVDSFTPNKYVNEMKLFFETIKRERGNKYD